MGGSLGSAASIPGSFAARKKMAALMDKLKNAKSDQEKAEIKQQISALRKQVLGNYGKKVAGGAIIGGLVGHSQRR